MTVNRSYRADRTRPVPVLTIGACLIATLLHPLTAAAEGARLLIENARLIDREGETEDLVVNILIVDGELDIVTREVIEVKPDDRVIQAQGGFLLGTLAVGEPPNFVIVSADPRIDFQVFLDSRSYVRLAVQSGAVVEDKLTQPEL